MEWVLQKAIMFLHIFYVLDFLLRLHCNALPQRYNMYQTQNRRVVDALRENEDPYAIEDPGTFYNTKVATSSSNDMNLPFYNYYQGLPTDLRYLPPSIQQHPINGVRSERVNVLHKEPRTMDNFENFEQSYTWNKPKPHGDDVLQQAHANCNFLRVNALPQIADNWKVYQDCLKREMNKGESGIILHEPNEDQLRDFNRNPQKHQANTVGNEYFKRSFDTTKQITLGDKEFFDYSPLFRSQILNEKRGNADILRLARLTTTEGSVDLNYGWSTTTEGKVVRSVESTEKAVGRKAHSRYGEYKKILNTLPQRVVRIVKDDVNCKQMNGQKGLFSPLCPSSNDINSLFSNGYPNGY
ncbi:uncharacterized protein LOC107262741 [Cephus cinctus]|uniref:Uncharacterized protein LOC107262741 n=1 Tax=Cephus cinctus TaxID=211228 RepID=A0AAJ7BFE2_CEPCN|nr:uncharacterized protein LOC107262741 [Cephus cinctus]